MTYVADRRRVRRPMYQPLGDAESDFRARVKALDAAVKPIYKWPQRMTTYPAAFVDEVVLVLTRNVVRPFNDTKIAMLKDKSNIGVFEAIADTGQHLERAYEDLLADWNKALDEAQRTGAKTYQMPRLRDQVIAVINGSYAAWNRFAYLEGIKPWYMQLGPVVDGVISALAWMGRKAEQLAGLVPDLPPIGKWMTWTLYATAGYLAYKLLLPPRPRSSEA